MKTKVAVIFGGASREREVSFAGGRTVYDNLDKSLFEAVPVFVDSFGNLILLNWEHIYKGSIRDFYPPTGSIPPSPNNFQVYAESLGNLNGKAQLTLANEIGSHIDPSRLNEVADIAFLCLHGSDGEDGRIQGLLEFYRIPYTGSGIFSSSIGINKVLQKELMQLLGYEIPKFDTIARSEWMPRKNLDAIYSKVLKRAGFPMVVKAARQGSSIGVVVLQDDDFSEFVKAVDRCFFIRHLQRSDWMQMDHHEKQKYVKELCDIREGIGIPVRIASRVIHHPEELLAIIMQLFAESDEEILIESIDGEPEVLIESFIKGKEFSCIVVEDENGKALALPPTEIRKGKEVYDYRSKYLPGLSRKITPIEVADERLQSIRTACEKLFSDLKFDVYARIDGFITDDGKVFLNDPNTTSGMLPSSFFFHQAAEIGLNPTQFLTYVLISSFRSRIKNFSTEGNSEKILRSLIREIKEMQGKMHSKERIAVLMGGFSSERHISVESGRNIFQKLASSEKYLPIPIFLTGDDSQAHQLYTLPVNILLKDNADDIREKLENYNDHPMIAEIRKQASDINSLYGSSDNLLPPQKISYSDLKSMCDFVFIALHGRPGEDGAVQIELEKVGLPYNGSGPDTSALTIDKFQTNELLADKGFLAASHLLVYKTDWIKDLDLSLERIESHFKYPFICKPVDDGCSSAVKRIAGREQLKAFAAAIFRDEKELGERMEKELGLKRNEEFPVKDRFMVEELIKGNDAKIFLEITGGLLTHYDDSGNLEYEVFEASETLTAGDVLSLEEKFLAGEGQNITPARYSKDLAKRQRISDVVKAKLKEAAKLLNIQGYARIDAFVRVHDEQHIDIIFIEVNSLPGMTPATCIFHQAALSHYKPYEFLDKIIEFGYRRKGKLENT